jgi:hypothetical protein
MPNEARAGVLQGTLDLMILQTLAAIGPQHGYAIAARLEQVSGGALQLHMGTLYPGLVRLEARLDLSHMGADRFESARPLLRPHGERPPTARQGAHRMAAHGGHHGEGAGVA